MSLNTSPPQALLHKQEALEFKLSWEYRRKEAAALRVAQVRERETVIVHMCVCVCVCERERERERERRGF